MKLKLLTGLFTLQMVLTGCGQGLQSSTASGSQNSKSSGQELSELESVILDSEYMVATATLEKQDKVSDETTDEEILADFKAGLERLLNDMTERNKKLKESGATIAEALQKALDEAIARVKATLKRLEEDEEFRKKIVAAARLKVPKSDVKVEVDKNRCEGLTRLLAGDLSKAPAGARDILQASFDKHCK